MFNSRFLIYAGLFTVACLFSSEVHAQSSAKGSATKQEAAVTQKPEKSEKQTEESTSKEEAKWVSLFDGKTMDGWEKVGKKDSFWEVKDGALCGSGTQSMLVYSKSAFKNFRYRVEVKINDGGNFGRLFSHTT